MIDKLIKEISEDFLDFEGLEIPKDGIPIICKAMQAYASQQTEKYKALIKDYVELCTYLTNYDALTPKGINSLVQLNAKIEQLKTELGL